MRAIFNVFENYQGAHLGDFQYYKGRKLMQVGKLTWPSLNAIGHLDSRVIGLRGGDALHSPLDAPAYWGGGKPHQLAPGDAGGSPPGAGV